MPWYGWVLMVLGWGSPSIVLCALVVRLGINGGCPKLSVKCWMASLISIGYGVAWYFLMGLKERFSSTDYLVSVAVAAFVGTAVARILCPKLLDK
jgi:hypothetical protein